MAEAIGVVASAVGIASFAVQTLQGIQKLSDIYASFRDAPQEVRSLLNELRILANILKEGEDDRSQRPPLSIGQSQCEASQFCKAAADEINALLEIGKILDAVKTNQWLRFRGSVRAALKRKRIKEHLDRLERAKTLLILACQHQVMRELRSPISSVNSDAQSPEFTYYSNPCPAWYGHFETTLNLPRRQIVNETFYWIVLGTIILRRVESKSKDSPGEVSGHIDGVSFLPAVWTHFRKGFEVLKFHAYGVPQPLFRPIRIINGQDAIWKACMRGDLVEAQGLCGKGLATPYDVTLGGFSLLHIAAMYHRASMCEWLIQQGVLVDSRGMHENCEYDNRTPLMLSAQSCGYGTLLSNDDSEFLVGGTFPKQDSAAILDTVRVLIELGGSDASASVQLAGTTVTGSMLHCYRGPAEPFSYLLHQESSIIDLNDSRADLVALLLCCWDLEVANLALEYFIKTTENNKQSHKAILDPVALLLCHVGDILTSRNIMRSLIRQLILKVANLQDLVVPHVPLYNQAFIIYNQHHAFPGPSEWIMGSFALDSELVRAFQNAGVNISQYSTAEIEYPLDFESRKPDDLDKQRKVNAVHVYNDLRSNDGDTSHMVKYAQRERKFWEQDRLDKWQEINIQIFPISRGSIDGSDSYVVECIQRERVPTIDGQINCLPGGWKE